MARRARWPRRAVVSFASFATSACTVCRRCARASISRTPRSARRWKCASPPEKLVLRPFECAVRALHFPPFEFKRARKLFEEALADGTATEVEKARAHLYLFVVHDCFWGGRCDLEAKEWHRAAAAANVPFLLCAGDEHDPVRAFEM
eukprot:Opistho-1_new@105544